MADQDIYKAMADSMLGGRKADEKVIYYKKPNGWIVWGDTQPSKQLAMMQLGMQPLPQYGHITDSSDVWGPILRHPQGPSEFCAEQVITFRWYQESDCPVKGVKFPCLAGKKIVQFPCPECQRHPFHEAIHLASHLRIMHGYDRAEIIAYGTATGIDFMKIPGGREVIEYQYDSTPAKIVQEEPEYDIAVVTKDTPLTQEEHDFACDCGWVPKEGAKRPDVALRFHRATHKEKVSA